MSSKPAQQGFEGIARSGGSAVISKCEQYRYRLRRFWGEGPAVLFTMLNPSTADAVDPDPTVTRCIGFGKAWNCGSLLVGNLFALRSTDPEQLLVHADPVGPDNDRHLSEMAREADLVVCAWGAHKAVTPWRVRAVLELIRAAGKQPMHLRLTKDGQPWHPLYLPAKLRPIPFGGTP